MVNNRLALSILTFNRTEILKENLYHLLPELKEYNIPVYISDNAQDRATESMIREFGKSYPYIYYSQNPENIGYDHNFLKALLNPTQDYVWVLGDKLRIMPGILEAVMNILDTGDFDFIGVDSSPARARIQSRIYDEPTELFKELYWHLTLAGVTIYSRKVINKINSNEILKYKSYPQGGIIFPLMLNRGALYNWTALPALSANKKGESGWRHIVFETFLVEWEKAISLLPEYYDNSKGEVLPKHAKMSHLFSFYNTLYYRRHGILNLSVCNKFREVIITSSGKPLLYFQLFSLIPKSLAKLMLKGSDYLIAIRNKIIQPFRQ